MRKISKKRFQPHNAIYEEGWFNHFRGVLEKDTGNQDWGPSSGGVDDLGHDHYYDRRIAREEVVWLFES